MTGQDEILTDEDIEELKKIANAGLLRSIEFSEWLRKVHAREIKRAYGECYALPPDSLRLVDEQIEARGDGPTLSDYGFDSFTPVFFKDEVRAIASAAIDKDRMERPEYKFDTFKKILEDQWPSFVCTFIEEMDRRRAAFDDAMAFNKEDGDTDVHGE